MKDSSLQYSYASRTIPGWRTKRNGHIIQHAEDFRLRKQLRYKEWTSLATCDWNHFCPRSRKLMLPRLPTCPETQLSARMVTLVTGYHWNQTWIDLVPARIGYFRSVDLAVLALLECHKYKNTKDSIARADSIRYYLEAIASVQETMSSESFWTSEEAQVAVGVLSMYQSTEGASLRERFSHKQGLLTLLKRSTRATEVVRAMAFEDVMGAYLVSCAKGLPSPLDSQFWLELEPTSMQVPSAAVASLGMLIHRLQIRLPRLIVLVRRLRTDPTNVVAMCRAIALADELLTLKAEGAENELLHCVSVIKPQHLDHAYIVPAGLKFRALAEFKAGVFYWEARITLHRLCFYLQRLSPRWTSIDKKALEVENCRMATNLLMSWESTFGAFGTSQGGAGTMSFATAMIAVWGVLTDLDDFHGQSSNKVRECVLEWCQVLQSLGIGYVSAKRMDALAEHFAGGPVQGILSYLIMGQSSGPPRYFPCVDEEVSPSFSGASSYG